MSEESTLNIEEYYENQQQNLDNYLNGYVGHSQLEDETHRTFEAISLNESNRINNRAITIHLGLVNNFASSQKLVVNRLYITLEQDWALCEAFYKPSEDK